GRRYLERAQETFDVITLDPPPPNEAAGSGLLYSREFYAAARGRLRPGGVLQQWFPGGDPIAGVALTRALLESFPEVRAFRSVAGWGIHFLASDHPIQETSAPMLAARLPPRAAADLVEWYPGTTPVQLFGRILSREIPRDKLRDIPPGVPTLTDDRPIN